MSQKSYNRIAKNTIMLYIRQVLILLINLYTVRGVLSVLGAEDYGIYGTVGGVVTFFSFLSGTMALASQRFFSFAIGEKNDNKLCKSFTTNHIIYISIALIAAFLLLTIGLWFINNKLVVPEHRIFATRVVFYIVICQFICTIFAVPFTALIIAHEDMQVYAFISILEVLLKLITVLVLKIVIFDKLITYALLLLIVNFLITFVYVIYSKNKYKECQFKILYWDSELFKNTLDFTVWTLFGQLTTVFRSQAVTILVNQVYGPVVVAARTIAISVQSHANVFSSNFNSSMYPAIIKSYAAKQKEEMNKLIFTGCKLTFFLFWVFALPIMLNIDTILIIWLKNPVENTALFTKLALMESLILSITHPLATAAMAPGKMRLYQLSLGSVQLLIFIVDLILCAYLNMYAHVVFVVAIIGNILMFIVRLFVVKSLINFPCADYLVKVIIPIIAVFSISLILSKIINNIMNINILLIFTSMFITVCITSIIMYVVGFDNKEKQYVLYLINDKIVKKILKQKK